MKYWIILCCCAFFSNAFSRTPCINVSNQDTFAVCGTQEQPIVVQGETVAEALTDGKFVSLQFVKVEGKFFLKETTVTEKVRFLNVHFTQGVIIRNTAFEKQFSLKECQIDGPLTLDFCEFKDITIFWGGRVDGHVQIAYGLFRSLTTFVDITFEDGITFSECSFSQFHSQNVHCNRMVASESSFENQVEFAGFISSGKNISLTSSSGFSGLVTPWFSTDVRTGLKDRIDYEPKSFLALEKAYREKGNDREANDIYFTYRKHQRAERFQSWHTIGLGIVEYIFLEIPSGYGTRPMRLFLVWLTVLLVCGTVYMTELKPELVSQQSRFKNTWYGRWFHGLYLAILTFYPGFPFKRRKKFFLDDESGRVKFCIALQQLAAWWLLISLGIIFTRVLGMSIL